MSDYSAGWVPQHVWITKMVPAKPQTDRERQEQNTGGCGPCGGEFCPDGTCGTCRQEMERAS